MSEPLNAFFCDIVKNLGIPQDEDTAADTSETSNHCQRLLQNIKIIVVSS